MEHIPSLLQPRVALRRVARVPRRVCVLLGTILVATLLALAVTLGPRLVDGSRALPAPAAGAQVPGEVPGEVPVDYLPDPEDDPDDPDSLRSRMGTPEAVFVVHDAVVDPKDPAVTLGYLAFCWDCARDEPYVYMHVVNTSADVGHALLNLEDDLGIDAQDLAMGDPVLVDAYDAAALQAPQEAYWELAVMADILEFLAGEFPDLVGDDGKLPPEVVEPLDGSGPDPPDPWDPVPSEVPVIQALPGLYDCGNPCTHPCCVCPGKCCNGFCCYADCCGDRCCWGDCCNNIDCCLASESCCSNGCCSLACCADTCCLPGLMCCGQTVCCDPEFCCANGECCEEACEECLDNGSLSGGEITVTPEVVCIGQTITFTVSGVTDSGGMKRVDCSASMEIPAVAPTYTWTITKPDGSTVGGTGPSADLAAPLPGEYSCTFTASAERECPPAPREIGPGKGSATGTELKSVLFTSDHGVLTDYNTDYAGSGGTVYNPRGWVKGGANNPITHTQGLAITVNVVLRVEPSGVTFDLVGDGPIGALDFHESGLTSSGSDQTVTITSDASLPAMIDVLEGSIEWTVAVSDGPTCGSGDSSGPHKVYVTWGEPGPGPTLKRVNKVCVTADGQTSLGGIADSLHNMVAAETTFDGQEDVDGWALLDGGAGDCDNQARCLEYTIEMLGAGPADLRLVRATLDAGEGHCLDLEHRVQNNQIHFLILDFDPGPGENWNACEACCEAAGHYYAITPQIKAANDYAILKWLDAESYGQFWVRTKNDVSPGASGWQVEEVFEEVPVP